MTQIDKDAEIDIVRHDKDVTVRIPLEGTAAQEWCRLYDELARARNISARAENHPSRSWILLDLPGHTVAADVGMKLDAATELIAQADAAGESGGSDEAVAAVREWWAQQRG